MKAYKIFEGIVNVLLTVLYLAFAFIVSCMFEVFPWHDGDGVYMLYMLVVWLPLCFLTIIQIFSSLIAKRFNKPLVTLASLNAVYIPLIFILGFADISFTALKVIGIVAVITMFVYSVLSFRRLKKL
ncbi:MAG: hypothetical protein IJB24_05040 [Clostridia bacterium]|nr:hypothetical protein [Clostridia bacterium]